MLTLVRHVQRHDESVVVSQMSSLHTLHFLRPVGPGAHVQAAKSLAWKLLPKMPAIPLVDENVAPHFALMCKHTPPMSLCGPLLCFCVTHVKHRQAQNGLGQRTFSNSTPLFALGDLLVQFESGHPCGFIFFQHFW
jgi:hypothetical protein